MANKNKRQKERKKMKQDVSLPTDAAEDEARASLDHSSPADLTLQNNSPGAERLSQAAEPLLMPLPSSEKMIPIYHLNQCHSDPTGQYLTYIVPMINNMVAPVQVRLIPVYKENQISVNSEAASSVVQQDKSSAHCKDTDGATTSRTPDVITMDARGNGNPSSSADILELKGNSNVQVNLVLPEGLPPMVPVLGPRKNGPGSKLVVEGNKGAQICMAPRDDTSDSPLPREEIVIKENENMQLYAQSGGSGAGNGGKESSEGKERNSNESRQDSAPFSISENTSSQIMSVGSVGAAASTSIDKNEACQIMRIPGHGAAATLKTIKSKSGQILQLPLRKVRALVKTTRTTSHPLVHVYSRTPVGRNGTPWKTCSLLIETFCGELKNVDVDLYDSWLRIHSKSLRDPSNNDISYADIKGLASDSSDHLLLIDYNNEQLVFHSNDRTTDQVMEIISAVVSVMSSTFPTVPLEYLFQNLTIHPADRAKVVTDAQMDSRRASDKTLDRLSSGALDGPTLDRQFSLADFFSRCSQENVWLLMALKHSTWFTQFTVDYNVISPHCLDCIAEILRANTTLEAIDFSESGLGPAAILQLATALSYNEESKIVDINFSNNTFDKEGVAALRTTIAKSGRGFRTLVLENTGITATAANELLKEIHSDVCSRTLYHLDFGGLRQDYAKMFRRNEPNQSILVFLGIPNVLQELNLSGGGMALEEIVYSLESGCVAHLRVLELSGNFYCRASSKTLLKWKRFFVLARCLEKIDFSKTKLPSRALKEMLEGLALNEHISRASAGISLDISSNNLGLKGAKALASMAKQLKNIRCLNISDNALTNGLSEVFTSFARDGGVRELLIGKNFVFLTRHHLLKRIGAAAPRVFARDVGRKIKAIDDLILMMSSEHSDLESLDISNSQLESETSRIISSLARNKKIKSIALSGNAMGDDGAYKLADVLRTNSCLTSLSFDRNNLSANALFAISQALQRNSTVQHVTMPSVDIDKARKADGNKVSKAMQIFMSKAPITSQKQLDVSRFRSEKQDVMPHESDTPTGITQSSSAVVVPDISFTENETEGVQGHVQGHNAQSQSENVVKKGSDCNEGTATEMTYLETTATVHFVNDSLLKAKQDDYETQSETSFDKKLSVASATHEGKQKKALKPSQRQLQSQSSPAGFQLGAPVLATDSDDTAGLKTMSNFGKLERANPNFDARSPKQLEATTNREVRLESVASTSTSKQAAENIEKPDVHAEPDVHVEPPSRRLDHFTAITGASGNKMEKKMDATDADSLRKESVEENLKKSAMSMSDTTPGLENDSNSDPIDQSATSRKSLPQKTIRAPLVPEKRKKKDVQPIERGLLPLSPTFVLPAEKATKEIYGNEGERNKFTDADTSIQDCRSLLDCSHIKDKRQESAVYVPAMAPIPENDSSIIGKGPTLQSTPHAYDTSESVNALLDMEQQDAQLTVSGGFISPPEVALPGNSVVTEVSGNESKLQTLEEDNQVECEYVNFGEILSQQSSSAVESRRLHVSPALLVTPEIQAAELREPSLLPHAQFTRLQGEFPDVGQASSLGTARNTLGSNKLYADDAQGTYGNSYFQAREERTSASGQLSVVPELESEYVNFSPRAPAAAPSAAARGWRPTKGPPTTQKTTKEVAQRSKSEEAQTDSLFSSVTEGISYATKDFGDEGPSAVLKDDDRSLKDKSGDLKSSICQGEEKGYDKDSRAAAVAAAAPQLGSVMTTFGTYGAADSSMEVRREAHEEAPTLPEKTRKTAEQLKMSSTSPRQ